MIELKNVERSYKTGHTETWVLRRIGLTIKEGEFVTVMGPSGAGKSSLLNVLALLDDSWIGEYWFGETPVHTLNRKQRADLARQRIGMVFQSYHLLDDLTVAENIDLPLSYKNLPAKERQGMVADILDRFQIVAKKDLFPSQLSGGQQQLVGIARAVVHIFEPASEYGTAGIEELQQQTVNLLSFQQMPKKVFDTQLAYALLAQLGSEAPVPLNELEDRIERHLASLLERMDGVPMPSLRLIQAPVFHGYSFSFWIEFEEAPGASDIEEAMNQEMFDVRAGDLEPPNNVGVAGQSGIAVGAITPDRNSASAFWVWAAMDNLRLAAESAALIAGEVA